MKAGKFKKIWIGGVMTLVLGASLAFSQMIAFADGDRIDTSESCSLTIRVADDIASQHPELLNAGIPVTVYQVADMDGHAVYTPLEGFEEIGLSDIGSETTAAEWSAIAERACQALGRPYELEEENEKKPDGENGENGGNEAEPTVKEPLKYEFTVNLNDGVPDTLGGLECGLYLVYAEETATDNFVYDFKPYLVSLPNSDYTLEGGGTDTWTHDVTMGLKPQQQIRYGRLVIEKTLGTVNVSMGGASCVFQVDAVKNGELVYSNVLSLNFAEPGTKQIVVDEIPVGAEVTVMEIYAGAGYKLTSDSTVNATVVTEDAQDYPATASFTNDYDYPGYGTSIVNHFERIGEGWEWNQQTDHAGSIGEE